MKPKLMLFKRLNILPSGMITGGYFQYNADDQSGSIVYQAEIDVHFLFFSKSFPFSGQTMIDPAVLKSQNMVPGKKFSFGPIVVEVLSIQGSVAKCSVSIVDGSIKGSGDGYFDISQPEISLTHLSIDGAVDSYNIHLEIQA